MKANEDRRSPAVANPGARRGAFSLAAVMVVCALAPYAAPAPAAEPLNCDPMYGGYVDVYDARSVASGTDCGTLLLTIHPTGSLSNAGSLSNFRTLAIENGGYIANVTDGSMLLLGTFVNEGGLDNFGRLDLSGHVQGVNSGGVANFGTFTNTSGLLNLGSFNNQGTFANQAPLTNQGTLVNGPDGILAGTGIITNSGTITNLSNAQLVNSDSLINSGTLQNLGGSIVINGLQNIGTFTNQLGEVKNLGELRNVMTLTNGFDGKLDNYGTISNTGVLVNQLQGTLTNSNSLSNLHTLKNEAGGDLVNQGRLSNEAGARLENHGTLTNTGYGRLQNRGTLENALSAVLENHGRLTNAAYAALDNHGTLGNTALFTNHGVLTNTGSLINTGSLDNFGTLTNAAGATLKSTGLLGNKEDAHFINSGALQNDGFVTNAGELASAGTIYGSGEYRQTGGKTILRDGLMQQRVSIDGGALAGDGRVESDQIVRISPEAVLAPGDEAGDIGAIVIEAPLDLFGSLEIDIDGLARFDSVTAGDVRAIGATWFNFYLGNDTSQSAGDSFDFFNALSFFNFDALDFRCFGLMSGLGCELNRVDGGRSLQLALNGSSGDGGGGSGAVAVPEPASLGIMLLGLLLVGGGLGWRTRCVGADRDQQGL